MMVVPWVLLLVVIVVAAGMIYWLKTSKNRGISDITSILSNSCNLHEQTTDYSQFFFLLSLIFTLFITAGIQLQAGQRTLKDRAEPPNKESEDYYSEVKHSTAKATFSIESNIAYATATSDTAAPADKHDMNYIEPHYI